MFVYIYSTGVGGNNHCRFLYTLLLTWICFASNLYLESCFSQKPTKPTYALVGGCYRLGLLCHMNMACLLLAGYNWKKREISHFSIHSLQLWQPEHWKFATGLLCTCLHCWKVWLACTKMLKLKNFNLFYPPPPKIGFTQFGYPLYIIISIMTPMYVNFDFLPDADLRAKICKNTAVQPIQPFWWTNDSCLLPLWREKLFSKEAGVAQFRDTCPQTMPLVFLKKAICFCNYLHSKVLFCFSFSISRQKQTHLRLN